MDHPIPIEELSPQVAKLCAPDTPLQMKTMAAKGNAPLGPVDLVTVLYVLSHDPVGDIGDIARSSLGAIPDTVMFGALDQLREPYVLDGLARLLLARPGATQKLMLNRETATETVVWMAQHTDDDRTLETIAANEERLLKYPAIIEALYKNKSTRMSTIDRAIELAARNDVDVPGIACFAEAKAAIMGDITGELAKDTTLDDQAFIAGLESAAWKELDDETIEAAYSETDGADEKRRKFESVESQLSKLNVSAKVRIATLGNSSQRAVLIRDSNKLVIMAVIKSPALTDSEVGRFAKFRTLPVEAVRYIGGNRDWTKHYSVKLDLVQNPRCPIEMTLRLLPHIRNPDLKLLARDKNIPQAVARASKALLMKRLR